MDFSSNIIIKYTCSLDKQRVYWTRRQGKRNKNVFLELMIYNEKYSLKLV